MAENETTTGDDVTSQQEALLFDRHRERFMGRATDEMLEAQLDRLLAEIAASERLLHLFRVHSPGTESIDDFPFEVRREIADLEDFIEGNQ